MFHCQQGSPIKVHDVKSPEVPAEGPWSPQYTGPLLLLETSTEAPSANLSWQLSCLCLSLSCVLESLLCFNLMIALVDYQYERALGRRCQHSAKAVLQGTTSYYHMNSGLQNIAQEWIPRERYIDSKVWDNLSTRKTFPCLHAKQLDTVMIFTVGVESPHGHDVAANVDGGAPLPGMGIEN